MKYKMFWRFTFSALIFLTFFFGCKNLHNSDITLEKIKVTTNPDKTEYFAGEELDTSGMVVTATYSDSSTTDVTADVTVTGFDSSEPVKNQILTVEYKEKTTSFIIVINPKKEDKKLSEIKITSLPEKLKYFENSELNTKGLVVTAYYNDETSEDVTEDVEISGFDSSMAVDSQIITVSYMEKSVTFEVKIIALEIVKIQVITPPKKLEYFMGEKLETAGMSIIACYNNATLEDITDEVKISGFDSHKEAEEIPVKISYNDFETSFSVKIKYQYAFHDVVEVLPERTDGTQGKNATYVLFGDYPQTVVPKSKVAELGLEESTIKVQQGSFEYVRGKDLDLYLKWKENEYKYEWSDGPEYKYSDGSDIEKSDANSYRWFKVEPIKWVVWEDNYNGGNFLIAENVLDAHNYCSYNLQNEVFDSTVRPNNYEKSEIRAFLNGETYEYHYCELGIYGQHYYYLETKDDYSKNNKKNSFLKKAFTLEAEEKIETTLVDNSERSTFCKLSDGTNGFACNNTYDKIFLPSRLEITKDETRAKSYNEYRIRNATDFAKANYIYFEYEYEDVYPSSYLLRSPVISYENLGYDYSNRGVYFVDEEGYTCGPNHSPRLFRTEALNIKGIVPALVIKF